MGELFATGRIVDLVLGFAALEGLLLAAWARRAGRGLAPADVLAALLPGAALMLALRAALTGAPWPWIAAWLFAALVTHLADLARRWAAAARPPP